jgi:hypothetical protein
MVTGHPDPPSMRQTGAPGQRWVSPTVIRDLIDADDIRVAWNGLSIPQHRAILESLQIKVIVKPARGGPGFKPESVSIEWSRQADQRS